MNLPERIIPVSISYGISPPVGRRKKPVHGRWDVIREIVLDFSNQNNSDWMAMVFNSFWIARSVANFCNTIDWRLFKGKKIETCVFDDNESVCRWIVYVRFIQKEA